MSFLCTHTHKVVFFCFWKLLTTTLTLLTALIIFVRKTIRTSSFKKKIVRLRQVEMFCVRWPIKFTGASDQDAFHWNVDVVWHQSSSLFRSCSYLFCFQFLSLYPCLYIGGNLSSFSRHFHLCVSGPFSFRLNFSLREKQPTASCCFQALLAINRYKSGIL